MVSEQETGQGSQKFLFRFTDTFGRLEIFSILGWKSSAFHYTFIWLLKLIIVSFILVFYKKINIFKYSIVFELKLTITKYIALFNIVFISNYNFDR